MKSNTIKAVLVTLGAITTTSLGMSIYNNRKLATYTSSIDKMSAAADKLEGIAKEFGPQGPTTEEPGGEKKKEEVIADANADTKDSPDAGDGGEA